MSRWASLPAVLLLLPPLAGCNHSAPPPPPAKTPEVLVGKPIVETVTDHEVFTGRTESSERVDIRARVTGYLDKAYFADGTFVKENDLLFLIDPRPHEAEVNRSEANLAAAKARLARIDRDYARAQPLVSRGTISREEFEKIVGDRDEAKAAVGVAESGVELARLNLKYTEVRAPFNGRISRRMVDPGSLVKADETVLSTLMALEPMYVYFDIDERTLLQLLKLEAIDAAGLEKVEILIGLSDETGFPHQGVVNFVDNRVDPNTGTMWMRGEFVKPKRTIKPGVFARVQFPVRQPYRAVMVAEQALGTDQGQKFLYVVGKDNKVEFRRVKVGRLHKGLRVILNHDLKPGEKGLEESERIVVSGLQRIRPGAEITPKDVEMEKYVQKPRESEDSPTWPPTGSAAAAPKSPAVSGRSESGQ